MFHTQQRGSAIVSTENTAVYLQRLQN